MTETRLRARTAALAVYVLVGVKVSPAALRLRL